MKIYHLEDNAKCHDNYERKINGKMYKKEENILERLSVGGFLCFGVKRAEILDFCTQQA